MALFKRFDATEAVSSQSQIKSSVARAIRQSIMDLYPDLEIDEILPKKEPLVLAKCADHVALLVVGKEPLFFQHRDGPWYPTLRLVHKFQFASWCTDAGAIKFVLSGANIMCPGLTHKDGSMDHDIPVGAPVIVNAAGKQRAMCVGQVKMTRDDITELNSGIAIDNLHFLGDGLWQTPILD